MTEAQWLADRLPAQPRILALLHPGRLQRTKAGRRKLRLLQCGCCRAVWGLLTDDRSRRAVEVGERLADGEVGERERDRAFRDARPLTYGGYRPGDPQVRERTAAAMALASVAKAVRPAAMEMGYTVPLLEGAAEIQLLRCLFGNPFRPITLDRSLLTPLVASLAGAAYEHRELPAGLLDPARLAVLSDALEEAGCTGEILTHLRSPGPHVRGCFAVDVVLARV